MTTENATTLWLLSRDSALVQGLKAALRTHSQDLQSISDLAQMTALLAGSPPGVPTLVVVDGEALADPAELAPLAAALASRVPAPSLVCLAAESHLPLRLATLRAGAAACLSRGLSPGELAGRIQALAGASPTGPTRVLIVEDQPVAALFAARVLESAGLVTAQARDPLRVLAVVEEFHPDLILMDLHLPGVSGIELTALIRGEERFADLPIVFLSGELDRGAQMDALRVGGDEFLAKPVRPEVLVETVRQRVAKARVKACRDQRAGPDQATGLARRERLLERLDRLLGAPVAPAGALIYLEHGVAPGTQAALAAALLALCGPADLPARIGERGLAVLVRRADATDTQALAESVGQAARAALGAADMGGVGVGWCDLSLGGDEAVTLVSRARKAALASLHGGHGRAESYRLRSATATATATVEVGNPIRGAIQGGHFQLLFQPMVDLRAPGRPRYEATPRLRTADGELLAPAVFAPLALRAGLMPLVDQWVLDAGLDALAERREAGLDLFLHQSLAQVAADDWLAALREAISTRDLIRMRPVIQFQLADLDRNLDLAATRCGQLARLGIRICINGFAPGARAERVSQWVAASFVRLACDAALGVSSEQAELLRGLHQRGIRVIVTGVEGPDQVARLWSLGVDLVQGPFIQPPAETMGFDFGGAEDQGAGA